MIFNTPLTRNYQETSRYFVADPTVLRRFHMASFGDGLSQVVDKWVKGLPQHISSFVLFTDNGILECRGGCSFNLLFLAEAAALSYGSKFLYDGKEQQNKEI